MKKIKRGYWFMAAVSSLAMQVVACGGTDDPAQDDDKVCVNTAKSCSDGKDNDCDGKIDCKDSDCVDDPACKDAECVPVSEVCDDGKDNDCDGKRDCDDSDCAGSDACKANPEDPCKDNTCASQGKICNPANGECVADADNKCKEVTCEALNTVCDMSDGNCVCKNDFVKEGGECIHEKKVDCDESTLPVGAVAIAGQVTITYSTSAGKWSAAAACKFNCDEDQGYVKKDGTCVSGQDDGVCKKDENGNPQHRENGKCVRNIVFEKGNAGAHVVENVNGYIGDTLAVEGTFTADTAYPKEFRGKSGRCPGVLAKLCYEKDGQAGQAKSFTDLTCVDAAYKNDVGGYDVYSANVTYQQVGDYKVFYKWSGDGGASWHYSDAGKVQASWEESVKSATKSFAYVTEAPTPVDGLSYHMDFNCTEQSDTNCLWKNGGKWVDDQTLPGWWKTSYSNTEYKNDPTKTDLIWNTDSAHANFNYYSSDGSAKDASKPQAGILSLGAKDSTERALGSLSSNNYQQTFYLVLKNESEKTLSNWTVTYTGEQWRTGNYKEDAGKWLVSYAVLADKPANMDNFKDGENAFKGTTEVAALKFTAPIKANGNGYQLDGNAAANRAVVSGSFTASVKAGQYLLIKWFDPRETGVNSSIGIDDLTVIGK